MNAIELICLEQLELDIKSIIERAHENNSQRMNHERIYVLGDAKRALEKLKALKDNNK